MRRGYGLFMLSALFCTVVHVPVSKAKEHASSAHKHESLAKSTNLAKSTLYHNMMFVDAEGQSHTLHSWNQSQGSKFVLLVVWASWCGPCITEMPTINALRDDPLGKKLTIVPIAIEAPVSGHAYTLEGITMPLFYSESLGVFMAKEGVFSIPTVFLYGPNGDLLMKETGARNWNSESSKLMLEKAMARYKGGAHKQKHHPEKRPSEHKKHEKPECDLPKVVHPKCAPKVKNNESPSKEALPNKTRAKEEGVGNAS